MGSRAARWVVALLMLTLAAGCTSSTAVDDSTPTSSTPTPRSTSSASYVALGDSFTSGPGLAPDQQDAGFCARSRDDWPSLLATAIGAGDFADLSCAGATTSDLLSTVSSGDIDARTKLVTVGVGGNDGALFSSLLRSCIGGNGDCQTFIRDRSPAILSRTGPSIVSLLDAIRRKAPEATVLLVGYLRIMPTSGTCDAVDVPGADTAAVLSAETGLEDILKSAADQASVTYVSLRAASVGHDACAGDDAWTNGTSPRPGDGTVFHPRRIGMQAVASIVERAVDAA